jgi:hypothetical protein
MFQQDGSKLLAIRSLSLIVLCVALFSFSKRTGGDTFAIYLNDKLLLQERVLVKEGTLKDIKLGLRDANAILKVNYSHCGQIGMERSLTIKSSDNKVLKSWDFSDDRVAVMTVGVKELLALKKDYANERLQLLYSSREMMEGKVLAAIVLPDDARASLK